jgi:probable HAF family extracellular repeat protein
MQDLGTLGGSYAQADWINDAGEVVGYSGVPGDQAVLAFLWNDDVMTNLGALEGDACSVAWNINSRSEVVGTSSKTCAFAGADRRASLWLSGQRTVDLNAFLAPGSVLVQLTDAYNINDRGEIVGLGLPSGCGDEFACGRMFVLIPCDDDSEGCRSAAPAMGMQSHPEALFPAAPTSSARRGVTSQQVRPTFLAYLSQHNRGFAMPAPR